MFAVHKFPLQITDVQTILMDPNAEILCVQMQGGYPYLWAVVDVDASKEERTFRILGTGHEISEIDYDPCWHIGTIQDGNLVWHIFELYGDDVVVLDDLEESSE